MPEQANTGGPRIGKPNRSGKSLKVFFDLPEYERLKEFCESTDRTMTVVVRRAVSEYLGRQGQPDAATPRGVGDQAGRRAGRSAPRRTA